MKIFDETAFKGYECKYQPIDGHEYGEYLDDVEKLVVKIMFNRVVLSRRYEERCTGKLLYAHDPPLTITFDMDVNVVFDMTPPRFPTRRSNYGKEKSLSQKIFTF